LMLTKVEIKNFKSFRDFSLDFGRNNVIVGANMSGKSNLVDFFKFVRDMLVPAQSGLYGVYSAFNSRGGFTEVAWAGAQSPLMSFRLEGKTAEVKGGPIRWEYAVEMLGNFQ